MSMSAAPDYSIGAVLSRRPLELNHQAVRIAVSQTIDAGFPLYGFNFTGSANNAFKGARMLAGAVYINSG